MDQLHTNNTQVLELLRFAKIHRRHTEALARATGDHFNIFQILRVGHLEVKTHSPILGELLNPKGSHGQGSTFLRLFLSQFGIHDFDAESDTVIMEMEYYGGTLTDETGGRFDIWITDGKAATILIENKIGAGDQDNQMMRYRAFDQKAHLFYLTLDGHEPSNLKEDKFKAIDCKCISYAVDILAWLKECCKASACLPKVRETITQYIHLIEELTQQSTTILMNKELINDIVGSKENLAAFFTLREAVTSVQDTLIQAFANKLSEIANNVGLELMPIPAAVSWRKKYDGFTLTTKTLKERNVKIEFTFDKGDFQDLYFGFSCIKHDLGSTVIPQIKTEFAKHFKIEGATENVPVCAWWHRRNGSPAEFFESLRSGQFAEDVKSTLEIFMEIIKSVCSDEATSQIG
jgi:hypothetical protein